LNRRLGVVVMTYQVFNRILESSRGKCDISCLPEERPVG
jgi:hypothetical protein